MIYIGVDPGSKGAIAMIDGTDVTLIDYEDLPAAIEVLSTMNIVARERRAALELVHAMPLQGVSSTFKFGENFGIWQGIYMATDTPFELVGPKIWQKDMFDRKIYKTVNGVKKVNTKKTSLEVSRRLFPKIARTKLKLAKHDGRADALLLAEWLRRKYENK